MDDVEEDAIAQEETAQKSEDAKARREETLSDLLSAAAVENGVATDAGSEWATATSKSRRKPAATPARAQFGSQLPFAQSYSSSSSSQPHQTHNSISGSSSSQPQNRPPKEPVNLSEETTLEIFDFPAAFRTGDLKAALKEYDGKYKLKWNNDTSCWFVFESDAERNRAVGVVERAIETRPEGERFRVRKYLASNHPEAAPSTPPAAPALPIS
jgi:hypothetical protein